MNKKRILSLVAATMLSVAVLAGCGSNGKIVAADYDEISTEGASKQSDAEYNKKMKEFGKVTNPEEAFPALEKAIVEKQSAEVDAFTGATSSSNNFKKLAAKAIENATAGNTEKAIVE
ncbi:MAG: FMN-binding protein [Clostridium sp.]|nr:FMN-binding protein [Clostridium sp.]